MLMLISLVQCLSALVSISSARRLPYAVSPSPPILPAPNTLVTDKSGATLPPLNTSYFFDQLIDHNDPSKGTFKQRYFTTSQFYEPGGPVVLMTPGETTATGFTGYLTNATILGLIAQVNNGTPVVIEHRFFGVSNPIDNLADDSLKLLTIDQAAKDLAYFAKNVHLPQPNGDKINADKTPWILLGGSYAGALTSWTMVDQPGVFWAGYASSAVVEAITDYWAYFEPIRQNMPKNCSEDIEAVITHVDKVFTTGTSQEIQDIKELFGMGDVTHIDDVASTFRQILFDWQAMQPYIGPNALFFQSCDALEVKDGVVAPATGWGLDHALSAWGAYYKNVYLPALCLNTDAEECLGTHNTSQSFWTDPTVGNDNRSWMWMVCNEVGYFQESAPKNWPTLVSRIMQPSYDERLCSQMFPKAFPTPPTPRTEATNTKFKGWNVELNRLFFANGKQDPWREATVSSDFHTRQSSPSQPIFVGNGFHCSDLIIKSSVDPTIKAVIDAGVATVTKWIAEWPGSKGSESTPDSIPSPSPFVPLSIPASLESAEPEAVPAVATQATGTGSPAPGGVEGPLVFPNAMVRKPLVL